MNHPRGELQQDVPWCTPWLPQRFTCVVGLLLFRLIRTIHRLQIGSWHPAPFILQLAKPPPCNESSRGKEQRVLGGGTVGPPASGLSLAGGIRVAWAAGTAPGLVSIYMAQSGNLTG